MSILQIIKIQMTCDVFMSLQCLLMADIEWICDMDSIKAFIRSLFGFQCLIFSVTVQSSFNSLIKFHYT